MKRASLTALVALGLTLSVAAQAQTTTRTELTKGDLTGTKMEIVVGTIYAALNTSAIQHTHAGEEAFTVTGNKTLKLLTVHIVDKGKYSGQVLTAHGANDGPPKEACHRVN